MNKYEPYQVIDEETASIAFWAIEQEEKKLALYKKHYEETLNLEMEKYQEMLAEKKQAYEKVCEEPNRKIANWKQSLINFMEAQQATNSNYRLKTVNGKLVQTHPKKWHFDAKQVGKRLANQPGNEAWFEPQAPKFKWGEYKKSLQVLDNGQVVDSNGEVVPDVTVDRTVEYHIRKA